MSGSCEGRVVVVTGAGQGLGRAHALELGRQGAVVVVNDVDDSAQAVASEVEAAGGTAIPWQADIADWADSRRLVRGVVEQAGRLDALVNNAGLVRDRMLVTMSEQEWDLVLHVDLKGHFCPLRHAAEYWREEAKAGRRVHARVVNTTSGAGLMGSIGQGNYVAAKAAVAALTVQAAAELASYGVTVNAIAPAARTSMTEATFADDMRVPDAGFDAMDPANVAPLVCWLVGADSGDVTGRVFEVSGGSIGVVAGWSRGPVLDAGRRWDVDEVGPVVRDLLAAAPPPEPVYGAAR